MKAYKFIKKEEVKKENKVFENRTFEVRDVNLLDSDWYWLYTEIMNDDYECAQDNGFYETENGYHSLDCQRVAERMEEWKEDMEEDEQPITDMNQDFQDTFSRILNIMNDNLDFNIDYEETLN